MNSLDIIILIFLACVIIYAITFNVNNTLNNKLSNIAINIPPITIPPAQITVKVQKGNALNDSYDVFIERQKTELNGQVVALSPIEGFSETNSNNPSQEELNSVENQSKIYMQEAQQQIQNALSIVNLTPNPTTPETKSEIQPKIDIKTETEMQNKLQQTCNKSLLTNKINAYGQMIWNSRGINEFNYPMCSDCCDNILSDDRSEDCVVKDYKKYQQYVKTYLEDPIIRGANVNDYDNLSDLSNIGKINLSNGEQQPRPAGYIFKTSPAYER